MKDLETENLESKTKTFLKICKDCNINIEAKNFSNCLKKNTIFKISRLKILKNVELISASTLNTYSLLQAKQIILTPMAINNIKEIYCD